MKFQKTLLAVSLAVATVGANAADMWVSAQGTQQQKNPVEALNDYYAKALSQDLTKGAGQTGEIVAYDLGSQLPKSLSNNGYEDPNTLVAKYKIDGKTVVEVISRESENATAKKTYYIESSVGKLAAITTSDFDSAKLVKENFLEGGVVTATFSKDGEIEEIKRANNETVKYGQIATTKSTSTFNGATVATTGESNPFNDNVGTVTQSSEKSVELGILAQKTLGDVTTNVYGVSAVDGKNVTTLTGNGLQTNNIVLANGNVATVDGRHGSVALVERTSSANQLVSEYKALNGQKIWAITDVSTQEKQYFTGEANNLQKYTGDTSLLTAANLIAGGASTIVTGTYRDSSVRNVISDKKVTYSEKTFDYSASQLAGQTTTNDGTIVTPIGGQLAAGVATNQGEQTLDLGVIGKNEDTSNKYGLDINKTVTDKEGKVTTTGTTITADGVKTTGYIDAADFRINGQSITASLDEAVKNATDGINQSVANIDGKIEGFKTTVNTQVTAIDTKVTEVDTRLTAQVGQLNSRVDQLNNRVDDVEKTSYRGIAIALAAQQQVPNIGAGQFAVFGGVGHYEGESAGAVGLASVFADGRTSVSAALGFAGDGEVGGRVGLAYVFGGK